MDTEIHEVKPPGFSPQVEVAACYIQIENKLLLVQRAEGKLEPGKWGVPGGKLEVGEPPAEAARRELLEETGISVESMSQIRQLGSLYIRKPEVDYVYHLFSVELKQMPKIYLALEEHQSYKWATRKDLEVMPLMRGAHTILEFYRRALKSSVG